MLEDPSSYLFGSGNLRNCPYGPTWWYMIFYSAGGFTFDDDLNLMLYMLAGQYAVDIYLQDTGGSVFGVCRLGHRADDFPHLPGAGGKLPVWGWNR